MAPLGSLFGIIELQNDPPRFADLWPQLEYWVANVGGFAAVGLVLWIISVFTRQSGGAIGPERRPLVTRFMWGAGAVALAAYSIALVLTLLSLANASPRLESLTNKALFVAGLCAIAGIGEPFARDFLRLRWRRIWALAKLSFKEAVRRRVVLSFMLFFGIFLFPASWIPDKPENELRKTINVIYYGMTPLLVLVALLLAAFSIPNDIKNQTIHTVVTKPVEPFEIVLGRFLGYMGLMTIALFVMTAASLILIHNSNIDPLAVQESMTARKPVYGELEYESRKGSSREGTFTPIDVGREYGYRKYIAGGQLSSQRAIWNFADVPSGLADRPAVPCEFAFDIYRTTKGQENKGVFCSFDIRTWKWDPARQQEYEADCRKAFDTYPPPYRTVRPPAPGDGPEIAANWQQMSQIAEKFGRYERRNIEVYDYHIGSMMLPPGLFKNAIAGSLPEGAGFPTPRGPARLQVRVKCESDSQFIGVAKLDLYMKEAEGSFTLNFFKASVGLWCRLCIVVLLAVAASTYLAGVISFLVTLFLFLSGYFQDFILSLAKGQNIGGGPFESLTRLVRGEVAAAELDKTPTVQMSLFLDEGFRWLLRRIMDVIPDVENYSWSQWVKEGFNIGTEPMIMYVIYLVGYLLPWMVLAYYLMKSREVAA